jgi:hypothetical protein
LFRVKGYLYHGQRGWINRLFPKRLKRKYLEKICDKG